MILKLLKNHTKNTIKMKVKVGQLTLCDRMDCSLPVFSFQGFSRQEYQSGLPFPSPGDLPDPGIEPRSPTLQADALPSEPPGKPKETFKKGLNKEILKTLGKAPLQNREIQGIRIHAQFLPCNSSV